MNMIKDLNEFITIAVTKALEAFPEIEEWRISTNDKPLIKNARRKVTEKDISLIYFEQHWQRLDYEIEPGLIFNPRASSQARVAVIILNPQVYVYMGGDNNYLINFPNRSFKEDLMIRKLHHTTYANLYETIL